MTEPRWRPGDTVAERFLRLDGSVAQLHPLRVLADDGNSLLGWIPDGTVTQGSRLADGRLIRDAPLADRFRLPRRSCPDTWRGSSTLRLIPEDQWHSVWWFFDAEGRFRDWYVNLEVPLGRGPHGPDRMDGVLDLAVTPDLRWEWKDEDEAEEALAAGRITAEQLERLYAEGRRIAGMAEAGEFPFDGSWTGFRPDPGWPAPELPAH